MRHARDALVVAHETIDRVGDDVAAQGVGIIAVIDKRPGGEWHSQIDDNWKPADFKPMVDPWKCPYHNGRMCMEMMRRLAENA